MDMGKKKIFSPVKNNPKKAKMSEGECSTSVSDMDSVSTASQPAAHAEAPGWFLEYMANFEARMHASISTEIAELTSKVSVLEKKVNKLSSINADLASKVDDLENRSRRNNLVFYGVPESTTTSSTLSVMKEVFKFAGIQEEVYHTGIERCHRTPSTPLANDKPRMIHICFQSFQVKESVRKACVNKFKSAAYRGQKLFVSDDFSKKVLEQRRNKKDEFQRLKEAGKKPFYLFPAKLAYKDSSGKLHIVSE